MENDLTIKQLIEDVHSNAVEKGFWDELEQIDNYKISTMLMLIVSELGEAVESLRVGNRADIKRYLFVKSDLESDKQKTIAFRKLIKDSFEDEIADAFIRIADLAGGLNIDLETHVKEKIAYNKTRQPLHGKDF